MGAGVTHCSFTEDPEQRLSTVGLRPPCCTPTPVESLAPCTDANPPQTVSLPHVITLQKHRICPGHLLLTGSLGFGMC